MDVACNREIKLGVLLTQLGILDQKGDRQSYLATGHYSRTRFDQDGQCQLVKGVDPNKDQCYYLSQTTSKALSRVVFPLGGYYKGRVKDLAREMGFADVAAEKESMGICFIGKKADFSEFLGGYIEDKPGDIVTVDGRVLGQHQGLHTRTIGQSVRLSIDSTKWIVAEKDKETRSLIVVPGAHHPRLYRAAIDVRDFAWISGKPSFPRPGTLFGAQCRYHQREVSCQISIGQTFSDVRVQFTIPQRAPTPGQVLVLYDGDVCLGGGMIC